MKTLPTTFKHDKFLFRQIDRQGDIALFEKTKGPGRALSYEVVIVQKRKEWAINGKIVPAHEAMPGPESWGIYGWTYTTRSDAYGRMTRLLGSGRTGFKTVGSETAFQTA